MVLVAVLAFQVYRTGEPERQALDLPCHLPGSRKRRPLPRRPEGRGARPGPERRQEEPKAEQAVRSAPPRSAEPAMSRPHASEEKGLGFAPPPGRRGSIGPSDRAARRQWNARRMQEPGGMRPLSAVAQYSPRSGSGP